MNNTDDDIFAAASDAIDTAQAQRHPAFVTRADVAQREAVRLAQIAELRSAVRHLDADPLTPAEKFHGGDMYQGFYAGMVVDQTDDYLAIWSKMAARVAILPKRHHTNEVETGAVVAIHAWGSRLVRIVELTAQYGWLDAFDDFAVEFQRTDRDWRMSISTEGITGDCFVLDGSRKVSAWYRDFVSCNKRTAR